MSISDLKKKIKQNKLDPLYLLTGTETFLVDELQKMIINQALPEEEKEFGLAYYDLNETPVQAAVEDAETLPFLGEKRVIILKNPLFLTAAKDKSKVEHDLDSLQRYAENPSPFTILIIEAPYEKLDERKKLVKTIKKAGAFVKAEALQENHLGDWLQQRAKQHGVSLDQEGEERLVQLTGSHLMLLQQEIDKMALYVGEGGIVNAEVVDLLVARTLENDIFALIDRIVRKDLNKAFRILYDLLKINEEPIKILSLIGRQFRIIYQVSELSKRGYGQKQMASTLKLHPYAVKIAQQQSRSFEEEKLRFILDQIAESDYEMKTGKMDKKLILELLVTKIKNA
ncbi:DNA polymerase III subunit delta [Bacillus hwajinpoensis]|uniref:DNA polymerase III subunit delta n=1 Tax=Guptibacillus hwajinpoensis TaxID=208199 RepID=A0A845EWU6_9BACL|nr:MULTISPECIES: DNA polymerase III subunit delta [Bacillaceae]MYL63006.1 DNA polymerase III subunit delta [Pseudalkalibacillus hwajinpoensis]